MTTRPNILFIFSDQQNWQAVGFEDPTFQSPNMDRIASEGIIFTESFCTTPQCSPSRSSMMTGLYPSKTGVMGNIGQAGGPPLKHPTIGLALQKAGYRTAYYGKWHLGKDAIGTAGWDDNFGVIGPETNNDNEVTRRAQQFLENNKNSDQPFALFLSYTNPHDIYHFNKEKNLRPTKKISLPATWYNKDFSKVPDIQKQFMREDQGKVIVDLEAPAWERYREIYREKVKLYDDELGKVYHCLQSIGKDDSTLVLLTSDHGDMDTHHRLIYKGPFMYDQMMRVPLVIKLPKYYQNSNSSKTINFPTVNVDLVPTLADFSGIIIPSLDGLSLKPLLIGEGGCPKREFIIGEYYSKQNWVNPIRMIRNHKFKLNLYYGNRIELYDIEADALETNNCANDEKYKKDIAELTSKLESWMKQRNDPFFSQTPTTRDGKTLLQ